MESRPNKKNNNVFFIGLLSFFGGISQDIFLPILPIYLTSVLGLSKEFIGLTEGLVTSSASIFRIIAGFLTDKMERKKYIAFLGYLLSMIGRLLLAFTATSLGVLGLRFLDGIGKGTKDSPKDALIAESTTFKNRGMNFGIARALDTFGSVVGPIMLFGLLLLFQSNSNKYQYIFLITAIPLIVTLLIIVFKVKDPKLASKEGREEKLSFKLPKNFYIFLGIMVIFGIGNSSDTFLILRAQNIGAAILSIPLIYALFNFVYASASIPLGSLSDKIGRERVIIIGWIAYALSYLGFGLANQTYQVWLLFAFYGIYYATTEGVAKALVADIVEVNHRGRAYGLYNAIIGLVTLPAGLIAGYLWDKVNASAPFIFGAILATLATICLAIFIKFKKKFSYAIN